MAALGADPVGPSVLRRCVDVADLVATGTTTVVTAALVWPGLRRLDRAALHRLAGSGVPVVAIVTAGSISEGETARSLGIPVVVGSDVPTDALLTAIAKAAGALDSPAVPGPRQHSLTAGSDPSAKSAETARGRLLAVWGPTGAPGRTTVAIGLASELARLGVETLLADADVYGGTIAPALGLLDEAPGLMAAARLAGNGRLTTAQLAMAARTVEPRLRVLTGIGRAGRWPELRVPTVAEVWDGCRSLATITVVDTGFCIEQDEEIVFDTAAPRRNGVTVMTLECADVVVVVGRADPLGIIRLVHALDELREALPAVTIRVVLNGLPKSSLADRRAAREVRDVVYEHTGIAPFATIPYDREACAAAVAAGKTLAEAAPSCPARTAMRELAAQLADVRMAAHGRRRPGGRRFSRHWRGAKRVSIRQGRSESA